MLCFILSEKKIFNSVLFRTANLKLKTKNLDIEGRGLESKVPEMRILLEWLGVILKKSFQNSSWIIIIIILNMILIMMEIKVMQYDIVVITVMVRMFYLYWMISRRKLNHYQKTLCPVVKRFSVLKAIDFQTKNEDLLSCLNFEKLIVVQGIQDINNCFNDMSARQYKITLKWSRTMSQYFKELKCQ